MAKTNRETFKRRQQELFENVAVRNAVVGYLNRKDDRRDEYEDELLAMLLEKGKEKGDGLLS